jgi:hypothetical protein
MKIELHPIPGMMVGVEFIKQDGVSFMVLDLLILRILFITGEA